MATIAEFAGRQNAFIDALDALATDLAADFKVMADLITKLQTTPGPISAADQTALDALETRSTAIKAKLDALNALTPPAAPVTPDPI